MPTYPHALVYDADLRADSLAEVLPACLAALADLDTPPAAGWAVPSEARRRPGALSPAEARATAADTAATDAALFFEGGSFAFLYPQHDAAGVWVFKVTLVIDETNGPELQKYLVGFAMMTRALLEDELIASARLYRQGGGVTCLPHLAVIGLNSHLVVASDEEIEDAYEQPEVVWNAGWLTAEPFGDKTLLLRGVTAADGPAYLAEIIGPQWDMARAAKPGSTKYYAPQALPEERPVYRAGEPTLEGIFYFEEERRLQMSCALDPGRHVNGWEVFDLRGVIKQGGLPDGRPVETARVVFLHPETAEREKRPLLDIGAEVCYFDAESRLIRIEE